MKLQAGDIVISTAGRDSGTAYVVVATDGSYLVQVADGRQRRLDQPKRKNIRHLRLVLQALEAELIRTDEAIRQRIAGWVAQQV